MEFLNAALFYLAIGIESFCLSYVVFIICIIVNKGPFENALKRIGMCYLPTLASFIISHNTIIAGTDYIWLKFLLNFFGIFLVARSPLKLPLSKAIFASSLAIILTNLAKDLSILIVEKLNLGMIEIEENINYTSLAMLCTCFMYFTMGYIISIIYKKTVLKNESYDEFNKYLFPQFLAIAIGLLPNMALLMENWTEYSNLFVILNIIQTVVISAISLYNIRNCLEQKNTKQQLEKTMTYNKTLIQVNEGVRGFKHDMGNIVQAILGYIALGDTEGIKKYCQGLVLGFNNINMLSVLSPNVINDPAIYGIVANKILLARDHDMQLCLDISSDVSKINFSKFELSRILGILIDNAIEAGTNTTDKKLQFNISSSPDELYDEITISNSINTPDIPLDKLFVKDYSTKKNPSGFGLYEVKQILDKNSQAIISTSIDKQNMMFSQRLKIFR